MKKLFLLSLLLVYQYSISAHLCKMETGMVYDNVARSFIPHLFSYEYKKSEDWHGNTYTLVDSVFVTKEQLATIKKGPSKFFEIKIDKKLKEQLVKAYFSSNEQAAISVVTSLVATGLTLKSGGTVALLSSAGSSLLSSKMTSSELRDKISIGDTLVGGEEYSESLGLIRVVALKSGTEVHVLAKETCKLNIKSPKPIKN